MSLLFNLKRKGGCILTDENIYSTPKAELTDSHTAGSEIEFFPSSQTKLAILYFATFGMYPVYWFYKNWKLRQKVYGENVIPFLRALFFVFFTHSLFKKIEESSTAKGIAAWGATTLATIFVLLTIISNVLEKFNSNTEEIGVIDYTGMIVLVILVWPIYVVQGIVNKVNNDPTGELNSSYSIYNYIFIVLGVLIWLLVVVGLFGLESDYINNMIE